MSDNVFIAYILGIGDTLTGKTTVFARYINQKFIQSYVETLGADFSMNDIVIDGFKINYRIWDLSGKKKFEKIRKSYYKGARGSILFFDLTQKETLDNIPNWYNETIFEEPDQFTVLVGTKKDLSTRRQVTKEEAETLSKQLNCKFYTEVSALTGEGVNELFMKISKLLQAVFDDSK